MAPRTRRLGELPLADRVFARAVMLGATSERPTEAGVHELWRLAGGNGEALKRALSRFDHPSGRVGHPGVIASALLRSALSYRAATLAGAELDRAAGQ